MRAGITGHQDLGGPDAVPWVRDALADVLDRGVTEGVTSLARGADQLFARLLVERRIPFRVVVPSLGYETTFENESDRAAFEALLAESGGQETLAYDVPSEAAYMAAGQRVVDLSDFLIAVWDGRPARGHGGTGDVVAFARARGKALVHVNPITRRITDG